MFTKYRGIPVILFSLLAVCSLITSQIGRFMQYRINCAQPNKVEKDPQVRMEHSLEAFAKVEMKRSIQRLVEEQKRMMQEVTALQKTKTETEYSLQALANERKQVDALKKTKGVIELSVQALVTNQEAKMQEVSELEKKRTDMEHSIQDLADERKEKMYTLNKTWMETVHSIQALAEDQATMLAALNKTTLDLYNSRKALRRASKKLAKIRSQVKIVEPLTNTTPPIEKTVVVVTLGRTGSTTLMAILNQCIDNAFIQGENALSIWWLYKYFLSVASYERYSPDSSVNVIHGGQWKSLAFPFYKKVVPSIVQSELQALIRRTIVGKERPRVAGFKEIRFLKYVQNDRIEGWDAYSDNSHGIFSGYAHVNETSVHAATVTERLVHFARWMDAFLPNLHFLVLRRDAADQSNSAWFKGSKDAEQHIILQNKLLEALLSPSVKIKAYPVWFEDIRSKNWTGFRYMFNFLKEPFNSSCVIAELARHHSF